MAAQVDDKSYEGSPSDGISTEGGVVYGANDGVNETFTEAPMAMFASVTELCGELVCLLKGETGVLTLDRPVERDSRVVLTVCVPDAVEPGVLVFQVRVKGVIMRDGEVGCHAKLCDDKSRVFIGRFLKQFL